ncbi:MAG TPA: CHASE4 domain-containing protein, partial [Xanthobacteraceae bacterium]|nr:CHASE4 domain-containing protein [Xanthobacteraceae bacterium]
MATSALPRLAEESNRSRPDRARLWLLVTIGVIAVAATVCLIVAVWASARHANEASFAREQQLIQQAIASRSARIMREVGSVAATPGAVRAIGLDDRQWLDRYIGKWLEDFFDHDLVVVVDGRDRIEYAHSRTAGDVGAAGAGELAKQLAASLDLLRGRINTPPSGAVRLIAQDAVTAGRSTALIQRFDNRPAIVAAVAIGSAGDAAVGNANAPIVVSVKHVDDDMLHEIGNRLQLPGLHAVDDATPAADQAAATIADAAGGAIARFAWQPVRPSGQIAWYALPFIAVAIAGVTALVWLMLQHMRRSERAIAAGETRLRHL